MNQQHRTGIETLEMWLDWLLDVVPEKDMDLEVNDFHPDVLNFRTGDPEYFQLVIMQLARQNAQLNVAFRNACRQLLLNEKVTLSQPTRVLVSDLLCAGPIKNENKKSTLVRDVLIIFSISILQEMGFQPTIGVESKSGKISGSQIVFEYLVLDRGLKFADRVETIQSIWSRRHARFKKIGLKCMMS